MTDKDEALSLEQTLRLALEALEFDSFYGTGKHEAITAIKAALSGEAQTRSVDKDEPVVWNEGVPAMLPKQKEGETFIVSYEPKLEAKDEPVAVKSMMGWVEGLKRQSDNGKYLHIPSGLNSGMCWELANELEQFINTTPPQQEAKDKPVAWMCADESLINKGYARFSHVCMGEWKIPVYTTPPPVAEPHKRTWIGLTDEERGECINANFGTGLWHMAKDIEAKLKEKNGYA